MGLGVCQLKSLRDFLAERIHPTTTRACPVQGPVIILRMQILTGHALRALKVAVMPHLDHITAEARIIGSAKTTWFTEDGGIVGINTDVTGIKNSLLTVITGISSPFPSEMPLSFEPGKSAGFLLGGGGAARAAVRAMIQLNLCPVLSSIEISLTAALIEIYPHANLRSLSDLFIAEAELGNLTVVGVPIVQEFVPFQQSHQRLVSRHSKVISFIIS